MYPTTRPLPSPRSVRSSIPSPRYDPNLHRQLSPYPMHRADPNPRWRTMNQEYGSTVASPRPLSPSLYSSPAPHYGRQRDVGDYLKDRPPTHRQTIREPDTYSEPRSVPVKSRPLPIDTQFYDAGDYAKDAPRRDAHGKRSHGVREADTQTDDSRVDRTAHWAQRHQRDIESAHPISDQDRFAAAIPAYRSSENATPRSPRAVVQRRELLSEPVPPVHDLAALAVKDRSYGLCSGNPDWELTAGKGKRPGHTHGTVDTSYALPVNATARYASPLRTSTTVSPQLSRRPLTPVNSNPDYSKDRRGYGSHRFSSRSHHKGAGSDRGDYAKDSSSHVSDRKRHYVSEDNYNTVDNMYGDYVNKPLPSVEAQEIHDRSYGHRGLTSPVTTHVTVQPQTLQEAVRQQAHYLNNRESAYTAKGLDSIQVASRMNQDIYNFGYVNERGPRGDGSIYSPFGFNEADRSELIHLQNQRRHGVL
eukprot:GILJ01008190.1.p1 GENE.GILJ01008190.1~~GILJ01008190.1.p1  ORF type:complete len:474 (+),score=52.55 GILJ01008190.1:724-2145(+)